jgi:hypothetical protein
LFVFNGCSKKETPIQENPPNKISNFRIISGEYDAIDNPFKISNVRATIEKFKDSLPELENYTLKENQIVEYVKLRVADIPEDKVKDMGASLHLVNYPLDAAMLYEPDLKEENLDKLKGEYFYTYLPKNSPLLKEYPFTTIYEIYAPLPTENWLEVTLLFDGGLLDSTGSAKDIKKTRGWFTSWISSFVTVVVNIVTPVQPAGRITYANTKLGVVGVPDIEVWSIKLYGFSMAVTNSTGDFHINSDYYIGSYLYCRFSNLNIHVLPVNNTSKIPFHAICDYLNGGANSGLSWFGKNSLPIANTHFDDIEKQTNFWSHIAHMDFMHRKYCIQEGILTAPTNLNFVAIWENKDENAAGTLMVNKMSTQFLVNSVFNLFKSNKVHEMIGTGILAGLTMIVKSLLNNILPDVKVSSGPQYKNKHFVGANSSDYSSDICKTILHELSHASMYNKVGDQYWLTLGIQESDRECGGNYGWGNIYLNGPWLGGSFSNINNAGPGGITNTLDDYIELSEAWAEFLGENYARRVFNVTNASTVSCRMCSPLGGGPNGSSNNVPGFGLGQTGYQFAKLDDKMEKGHAWADEWIPCGMFHDLMDVTNTDPTEQWDIYGGYTIAEMFNAFDNSRPAHIAYLTHIAPMHGYNYTQLQVLFNKNLKM